MAFRTAIHLVLTATRPLCASFEARGLQRNVQVLEPREASYEELLAFHTPRYVDFVRERSQTGQGFLDAGDTPAFRGVFEAAATVVGASITASEAIMNGTARAAFVPIAGLHHAGRDHAAGFCVFNDCGVVIELLRSRPRPCNASATSTSMPITAMGCTSPLRMTPRSFSPTSTRMATACIRAPARLATPARRGGRYQTEPAARGRIRRSCVPECLGAGAGAYGALRTAVFCCSSAARQHRR